MVNVRVSIMVSVRVRANIAIRFEIIPKVRGKC